MDALRCRLRYGFERKNGKPLEVRFNVENLFVLNYSGLGLGQAAAWAISTPRTFLLSLGTRF